MKKPKEFYEANFWANVQKSDGCWEWQGGKTGSGYGAHWNGSKLVGAHRYSYELKYGPMPKELFACHKCDNPGCVNPDHIFPGTPKENMHDMQAKGRKVTNGYDKRTHCIRGHELAGANLLPTANGSRQCRTCSVAHQHARRERVKAAAQSSTSLFA